MSQKESGYLREQLKVIANANASTIDFMLSGRLFAWILESRLAATHGRQTASGELAAARLLSFERTNTSLEIDLI